MRAISAGLASSDPKQAREPRESDIAYTRERWAEVEAGAAVWGAHELLPWVVAAQSMRAVRGLGKRKAARERAIGAFVDEDPGSQSGPRWLADAARPGLQRRRAAAGGSGRSVVDVPAVLLCTGRLEIGLQLVLDLALAG